MGRRALKRIKSDVDLSTHFKVPADLPACWDPVALFGRNAPVEVEVGSGKGLFLAAAAAGQPETDFLGIEISYRYAQFAATRLAQRGLANGRMIHGDATELFSRYLPDGALAGVHTYFPDPWWKARHKKRRVLSEGFLKDVERVLRPGGLFHFWTDVEEYFETTLSAIAQLGHLVGPQSVSEKPAEHDLDYRTHFERRTRLSGLPVYRAEFRKPG
ncbi:MAG TPA: tRNA (guanosine(46)-N7)-methyltransferase TrmB [Pirellulales bacterium]|jgi:tRNA (guanine-N7-)-methyltransferase|nr:tRNA (guanosine(46)-N7)-methyltransferase TrmB [Pirellulales bacterium]